MDIIKNISVVGDSLLKGIVLDDISGKYKLLKESAANLFGKTNDVVLSNHSKFGCTSKKALERLPLVLNNQTSSEIVLIELGGNDCDFNWQEVCASPSKTHFPNVSLEDFKQNICRIVEGVLSVGKRPVIMTLPPIDSQKYFNWISGPCKEKAQNLLSFLKDKNYIYRHQELYANALERVAYKHNLYTVNIRELLLNIPNYPDFLCLDGIHLNQRGQAFIKHIFDITYKRYLLNTL